MVNAGIRYVVMEVSSQALKLDRVSGFTYDYGIFTNLEEDHIGEAEHPDMADYIRCKGRLFQQCKVGLANADADYLTEVMAGHTCQLETFGLHERGRPLRHRRPPDPAPGLSGGGVHPERPGALPGPGGHSRRLHGLQLPGRHRPVPPSGGET